MIIPILLSVLLPNFAVCSEHPSTTEGLVARLNRDANYINISKHKVVQLDMRYATTNNFLKRNLYNDFNQCFLHKLAAAKFARAEKLLDQKRPGWKFVIFDCLRPRSIQKEMWKLVEKTQQEPYVADPQLGSLHNFGFAIDLSLANDKGRLLDMGTPFDFFGPLAEPEKEQQFLQDGKLTRQQIDNRKILRSIMQAAGFSQRYNEWWHYDALELNDLQGRYPIIE